MKKQTPFGDLEILDAHAHFFSYSFFSMLAEQSPSVNVESDRVAQIGRLTDFQMPPEDPREFAGHWAKELDKHSISRGLFFASLPNDETAVAAAVRAFPDRIFGGFFFNPLEPNAVERAETAFDQLNLQVLGLFPAMHGFSVTDHEAVRAIAEIVSHRKGTAIFVHCGALSVGIRQKLGLKSAFDLRFSNPLEVHKLASEFPGVNFIIPHFGAGYWRETLMSADLCPNIFIDTSSSNKWINYESAELDLKKVFEKTLKVVGTKRLLFGTDSSYFPRGWNSGIFDQQVRALFELGIDSAAAEDIFGGNLLNLLSRNL